MRNFGFHLKKILVWIVLILQILLIGIYFLLRNDKPIRFEQRSKISFVKVHNTTMNNVVTYQRNPNEVLLPDLYTSHLYIDYNSSLCYKTGTDLKQMRGARFSWKCKCWSGWHGNDCGQPEVIGRALLAYRSPVQLKGPRRNQRRIIYLLTADEISLINTEIIINELNLVVDLFILYKATIYLNPKLSKKILYLNVPDYDYALKAVKAISNIEGDDIVIIGGVNEIPNTLALQFLKLYDHWPQPLQFRYRWNVYGYFWMHPSKTIVRSKVTTVSFMYESITNKPLIVGDLNHFGGWFCQFCYESNKILDLITRNPNLIKLNKEKIDTSYIEDFIENGIYLDSKTELIRARSYFDYYAPVYVVNNSWKYDWLVINLYSKLDYD